MIVIITAAQDFHALTIQARVRKLGYDACHVVEVDNMTGSEAVSIGIDGNGQIISEVATSEGRHIDPRASKVIWLRRLRANQARLDRTGDAKINELIDNECRGALSGLISTCLSGKWISKAHATFGASDKIYQLSIAAANGFRVPRTLVSQSKSQISTFFDECNGRMIVKPIVGVSEPFLEVKELTNPAAIAEEAFLSAPATYQELIEGTLHLRLLSFGQNILCGVIDSEDLDWRADLRVPMKPYAVQNDLADLVRRTLGSLELEMGVIDIKLTPEGEPVWFEVNPQGQFLFLQPLINVDMIDAFARYLIDEAGQQA